MRNPDDWQRLLLFIQIPAGLAVEAAQSGKIGGEIYVEVLYFFLKQNAVGKFIFQQVVDIESPQDAVRYNRRFFLSLSIF